MKKIKIKDTFLDIALLNFFFLFRNRRKNVVEISL